jgi:heme exporter protein A
MLEAMNLSCARGERRLFSGLNFSLRAGNFLQAFGANGSGKTSLLRIICGLMAPVAGEVRWEGTNIRRLGEEYFGAIAYVAHQNGVKDELNPIENLRISSGVAGRVLSKREAQAILERVGLSRQQHLPARLLSAGQRRRLALSRLPASRAKLWILDEPLASLDDDGATLARNLISEHLGNDGMAIIATHQEMVLSAGQMQKIQL